MAFTPVMCIQKMQLVCQSLVGKEGRVIPKGYRNETHLDWGVVLPMHPMALHLLGMEPGAASRSQGWILGCQGCLQSCRCSWLPCWAFIGMGRSLLPQEQSCTQAAEEFFWVPQQGVFQRQERRYFWIQGSLTCPVASTGGVKPVLL